MGGKEKIGERSGEERKEEERKRRRGEVEWRNKLGAGARERRNWEERMSERRGRGRKGE